MTAADWAALADAKRLGGEAYLRARAGQAPSPAQQTPVDWAALQAMQAAGLTQSDVQALAAAQANNTLGTYNPPSVAAPAAPPPGTTMTVDQNGNPISSQDATAILAQELTGWGFGQDAIDWAKSMIQSNNSIDQILYSMRQQDFYKNSIFGQVAAARTKANLPAMTEAQILSYKDYAVGVAQQAGLPQGFITDAELTQLMGNDVSTSELDARITQGYQAAIKAPPDVLNQLQSYYGVTTGQLAAYYLDPTKALPLIQQQFQSAQVGAQATRTGFGQVDQATAMYLTQLGVTDNQAQTGFTKLAQQQQIMNPLVGNYGEQAITQQQQLAAQFAGNAQDQMLITQREQQRLAPFQENYHFAETQNKGLTGLGTTQRAGA